MQLKKKKKKKKKTDLQYDFQVHAKNKFWKPNKTFSVKNIYFIKSMMYIAWKCCRKI